METTKHLLMFMLNYDVLDKFGGSYENLLDELLTSNIPVDLALLKFFEFVFSKNKTINEIYKLVNFDKEKSSDNDKKSIESLIKMVSTREIKFLPYDYAVDNAIAIFPIKMFVGKKDNTVKHTNYPIPDPEFGRPRLSWAQCRYGGCMKLFDTPMQLIDHLLSCNAYTKGYHYFHEVSSVVRSLTPDEIIKKNLTKCPAYICSKRNFDTPQDLINHLKYLGLEPFWQVGMDLTNELTESNGAINVISKLKKEPKLFVSECIFCNDADANVLINSCRHSTYCMECYATYIANKKGNADLCPVCKTPVDFFCPYG